MVDKVFKKINDQGIAKLNTPIRSNVLGLTGIILLAVLLLSFSPAYGGTITENFTNNQYDTKMWGLWSVFEGTNAKVTNNRLEVAVAGSGYAGITSYGFTLEGDFEMQVDFSLIDDWDPDNGTQLYITANNKSFGLFQVGRGNIGPTTETNVIKEVYFTSDVFGGHMVTGITGPTLSGKLRLVRKGNKMEGSYWNGTAWQSIGSANDASLGYRVMISLGVGPYGDNYSGIPAKVAFDNIQITYANLGPGFWSQVNPVPAVMNLLLNQNN